MQKNLLNKKIIFWGTAPFASQILEGLIEQEIKFSWIISQPDKPAGRKKILKAPAVKVLAQEKNLPLKQFGSLDQTVANFLKKEKPDLFLVAAYGKILPKAILEIPIFGSINVHGSFLPEYRGSSPIQTALLDGKKETGVSLILMNEKMDEGPILKQEKVLIDKKDTYLSLEKKIAQKTLTILSQTLSEWFEKKIIPIPQMKKSTSYCSLIKKSDGKIDWNENAEKIFNRFRGFSVWPGIYTFWQKNPKSKLKLSLVPCGFSPSNFLNQKMPNGKVFLNEKNQLCIQASQGFLIIESLQLEGKKMLKSNVFLSGQKTFLDSILN